jgi:hypothetical protein
MHGYQASSPFERFFSLISTIPKCMDRRSTQIFLKICTHSVSIFYRFVLDSRVGVSLLGVFDHSFVLSLHRTRLIPCNLF